MIDETQHRDSEVAAIERIVHALERLPQPAQQRIMGYLCERYPPDEDDGDDGFTLTNMN